MQVLKTEINLMKLFINFILKVVLKGVHLFSTGVMVEVCGKRDLHMGLNQQYQMCTGQEEDTKKMNL